MALAMWWDKNYGGDFFGAMGRSATVNISSILNFGGVNPSSIIGIVIY